MVYVVIGGNDTWPRIGAGSDTNANDIKAPAHNETQ